MRNNQQAQFNFDDPTPQRGYSRWLSARKESAAELARKMHLPLGHQVEVWLYGGIRLRGVLHLKEERLFVDEERVRHLELMVEKVVFTIREMESCVRLD